MEFLTGNTTANRTISETIGAAIVSNWEILLPVFPPLFLSQDRKWNTCLKRNFDLLYLDKTCLKVLPFRFFSVQYCYRLSHQSNKILISSSNSWTNSQSVHALHRHVFYVYRADESKRGSRENELRWQCQLNAFIIYLPSNKRVPRSESPLQRWNHLTNTWPQL